MFQHFCFFFCGFLLNFHGSCWLCLVAVCLVCFRLWWLLTSSDYTKRHLLKKMNVLFFEAGLHKKILVFFFLVLFAVRLFACGWHCVFLFIDFVGCCILEF